jgi:hypothetical protein
MSRPVDEVHVAIEVFSRLPFHLTERSCHVLAPQLVEASCQVNPTLSFKVNLMIGW